MNVESLTLPNGLRIVHCRDASTAMVALNVLYDVGSRDELPELTGMAHLFEHLMFGGSVNIADFDGELQRAGGTNNAWTSTDFTNFYDVVPAHNVETAFRLESDRMLSPSFDPDVLVTQKSVVIEEFKQTCLNRPYGRTMHYLRDMAYKVHPYRWPVIGLEPEHIEKVTDSDTRRFFAENYGPASAVLAVTGNISSDEAFRLAEKWFGDIPCRPREARNLPVEPLPESPRRLEIKSDVPSDAITIAFPMGGYGESFPADILTDILASGKSSRFYRNLLMKTGLFASVDAMILGSEDPGLLTVQARLATNGADVRREAEKVILDQLEEVVKNGVTEREVQRSINRYVSDTAFANISYVDFARTLALGEIHGEKPGELLDRYRSITPEIVNESARTILRPEVSSTLIEIAR